MSRLDFPAAIQSSTSVSRSVSAKARRSADLSAAATSAVSVYDWTNVARDVLNVYQTVVLGTAAVGVAH